MLRFLALAMVILVAAAGHAHAWPDQSLRLVVPFAAGGTTDVVARLVGERLAARIGKTVIIENIAGAGGNSGAALVAKSPPDGYTLLMATPGQAAMNQFMYRRMPYDTATAFAPVAYIASVPSVLVVAPSLNVASTADFLTKMKARPDEANFGSAGMGSTGHLGGTLLAMKTGLKAQHVPYRGSAPMLQDLLAGNIQFTIDTAPGLMSFITSGTLKALAVTGETRPPALADVPNNVEAGIPDVEMASWLVILAPAGTPKAVIDRLNAEIEGAVGEPVLKEKVLKLGAVPTGGSPQAVTDFLRSETEKWKAVIRAAAIQID
jgi:tripartite-type tricarboxylate transporter receptor subunit TctC